MRLTITLLFLFCFHFHQAQDTWELKKFSDEIRVYTKPVSNSGFDAFRAEMEVQATVDELVYILKNIDRHKDIFPDTEELTILARPTSNSHIQYSRSAAPWPVSDRDGIYQMDFFQNEKTGEAWTTGRALPNYLPEKPDVVRIQKSQSSWHMTPIGEGKIKVVYEVQAEPGGNIPDWLANSAAVEIPYETMQNLRKHLLLN